MTVLSIYMWPVQYITIGVFTRLDSTDLNEVSKLANPNVTVHI